MTFYRVEPSPCVLSGKEKPAGAGAATFEGKGFFYGHRDEPSLLRSHDRCNRGPCRNGRCLREFFCYEGVDAGQGYFISTYQGDGSPLPTFAGEPLEVTVPTPEEVWQALNADNKVSLYTNVNGEVRLFNKNLGD